MTTPGFKRKLSAVLMADVVGYSRLMGDDEAATLETLNTYHSVMAELIAQHRGRIVDAPGDAVLAEFSSVVDAVQCAVAVQKELEARNAHLPEHRRMQLRIGINLGDVIEEGDKIYGDGVNIAARLEALADAGGICVSRTAFDHIESKLPLGYEFLGEKTVKNIARPVGAYRVLLEPRVTVVGELAPKRRLGRPLKALAAAGLLVLLAAISLAVLKSGLLSPRPEKQATPAIAPPAPSPPLTQAAPAPAVPPAPAKTTPAPRALPPRAVLPRPTPKTQVASPEPVSPPPQEIHPATGPTPAPPAEALTKRSVSPQASPPAPVTPETHAAAPLPRTPAPAPAPQTRVLPPAPMRGPAAIFHSIDSNNDGKISLAEWLSWRDMHFSALDKNNDGFLTRDELSAARGKFARKVLENFDLMDTNQDQKLSRQEFDAGGRRRFLMLDTNRDGYLSQEEFNNAANPRFGGP
jgi:class 3 adenylate cyclase/Ca2+-binding EF-hand superfamily protein